MTNTKIERLKAIKEEYARVQTALVAARKLEESAQESGMSALLENDLEQAELVLAAQDMMSKLQNMAEDLAKMNAQDLFPLVDKMKAAFGPEAAHVFEGSVQEAITNAMNTVRHGKDEMGTAILRLEGKVPQNDMGADAGMGAAAGMPQGGSMDPMAGAADAGQVDMAMDDFGAADAASGPEEEPLGRARKESIEGGTALNESVLLEAVGQKLIESEGLASLLAWVLNEAATGMPEEHFRSFATSIANRAAKDPVKTAGWIGKKKYGNAACAQLADPVRTQNTQPDLSIVESEEQDEETVEEGKSFKNNDDGDDNWNKKNSDKARSDARKGKKKGDDLEEGKSFKNNDDDDDNWDKKSKDKARSVARKAKQGGDEKVDETTIAAHALARIIEANIKKTGRGEAAKSVKETVDYLNTHLGLMEGEGSHELNLINTFESVFGMKPAAFSVSKLKELAPPMNQQDKKTAGSALGKMAGQMGTDKSAGTKSVQTAMQGMDSKERTVANKMLNQMKRDGKNPKNAGEFAAAASGMVGEEAVVENINAAHWPVDSMGQYKGEPFQTDYQKLKANPKTAAKTEGGAPETKVEEPKVDGAKAPEGGKPWEKKSETKSEPKAEEPKEDKTDDNDSEK